MPRQAKPLLRRIALAAAAMVVALVLAEFAAKFYATTAQLRRGYEWLTATHLVDIPFEEFAQRQGRIQAERQRQGMERGRSHPILGWTYNPGFRMEVDDIQVHVNSLALRGEEFPLQKPAGELRVLCLGGSTTACEEVDESSTWPARLQALLRDRWPGRAIRVINAGIPTYDVRMSWLDYSLRLVRLDADVVLVYHGINDLRSHLRGSPDVEPSRNYSGRAMEPFVFEGDARSNTLVADLRAVLGHSQFVRMLDAGWKRLHRPAGHGITEPSAGGIATFEATYRALLRQIRASGAIAVPITFAIAWPGHFDAADQAKIDASFAIYLGGGISSNAVGKQILDAYNESIRRLAREEHTELCELAGRTPADRAHFTDSCHFTKLGNSVVADALLPIVAPLLRDAASAVPASSPR